MKVYRNGRNDPGATYRLQPPALNQAPALKGLKDIVYIMGKMTYFEAHEHSYVKKARPKKY